MRTTRTHQPTNQNTERTIENPQPWAEMLTKGKSLFFPQKYKKNREVDIDNTSYNHIASWQSQSLGNRSPDKEEVSSGIDNTLNSNTFNMKNYLKHCQRHNGPEG